ncbi:hypothetical protein HYH02_014612 [Chlamydomonas schloesseri]|uniref:Uncharacterized protein n=1 Tax=Chlamydomonas schloesseri TaxID=2026947 RepID=A0A835VSB0_9CHLO|nr:hypothetical protein HYH02_014612 [Chlamydomonas schloesseri]|eukprot:KAG2427392.1 hypothetical protein HYH02_014612 [Chlamydomonas schloesseri]
MAKGIPLVAAVLALCLSISRAIESPWISERIAIAFVDTFDDFRIGHEQYQHFVVKGTRSKAAYAARQGYDLNLIVFSIEGSDRMNWNKLYWTRKQFGVTCKNCSVTVPLCHKYDWIMWMDNDIFITNMTVRIQDVIEAGRIVHGGEYPHFIATRDNLNSINTGTALVRCSRQGLALLDAALALKGTESVNRLVGMFDHNGAIWQLHDEQEWVRNITALVPAKLMNAYPWMATGQFAVCPDKPTCDQGHWSPGDFLIHFAGDNKRAVVPFLRAFPPSTWIGYNGSMTY